MDVSDKLLDSDVFPDEFIQARAIPILQTETFSLEYSLLTRLCFSIVLPTSPHQLPAFDRKRYSTGELSRLGLESQRVNRHILERYPSSSRPFVGPRKSHRHFQRLVRKPFVNLTSYSVALSSHTIHFKYVLCTDSIASYHPSPFEFHFIFPLLDRQRAVNALPKLLAARPLL